MQFDNSAYLNLLILLVSFQMSYLIHSWVDFFGFCSWIPLVVVLDREFEFGYVGVFFYVNCAFQLIYNKALQINPHLSVKNVMLQVQTSSLEMGMTLFITD